MSENRWSRIYKLVIVTKFTTLDQLVDWRTSLKEIGLNINDCTIICEVSSKKERAVLQEMGSVVFATASDLGFFGKIKNEELKKIYNQQQYDALIQIGITSPKLMRLFKKMKCRQMIGINTNLEEFEIELSTNHTQPVHIINFVKNTLEKIT